MNVMVRVYYLKSVSDTTLSFCLHSTGSRVRIYTASNNTIKNKYFKNDKNNNDNKTNNNDNKTNNKTNDDDDDDDNNHISNRLRSGHAKMANFPPIAPWKPVAHSKYF